MDLTIVKQRFGIIGNNDALNRALEVALRVAPTDLSVLVTGESGVGKEFFPQIIHANSSRKHGNYIAVNCGAIPDGTIDSELFGHEKGAFTGATESRKGYFEVADGGTIFLDEVAELPHTTQVRLLRVLQTGEFIRVGSSKAQKTNVRVVAATNINLRNAIGASGRTSIIGSIRSPYSFLLCGSAKETSICFSESSPSISQRSTACRPFRWTSRQEKCSKATVGPAISASSKT